ncbi:zinc ribbon domain-containing protein [Mediterraneibacter gnavus]|uniref:zinc ribbon domain-containing protein n=1 Tax=Mediterraneibacter gnavus TaxID=33038 RepID=UPI003F5E99ED
MVSSIRTSGVKVPVIFICSCGNRMDRDENAAVNICREGLRMSGIILEKSEKAS